MSTDSTILNEDDLRYVRLERHLYGWGIACLALMVLEVAITVVMPALDGSPLSWGLRIASWVCLAIAVYCAHKLDGES